MKKEELTTEEKQMLVNSLDNTIAGITDAILKTKEQDQKRQLRVYLTKHQDIQSKFT